MATIHLRFNHQRAFMSNTRFVFIWNLGEEKNPIYIKKNKLAWIPTDKKCLLQYMKKIHSWKMTSIFFLIMSNEKKKKKVNFTRDGHIKLQYQCICEFTSKLASYFSISWTCSSNQYTGIVVKGEQILQEKFYRRKYLVLQSYKAI